MLGPSSDTSHPPLDGNPHKVAKEVSSSHRNAALPPAGLAPAFTLLDDDYSPTLELSCAAASHNSFSDARENTFPC